MPRHRPILRLIIVAGALLAPPAMAAETAPCPERPPRPGSAARPPAPAATGPLDIRARELRAAPDGVSEFIGDVELRRGGQSLSAGYLRHDQTSGQAEARDNIQFKDGGNFSFQAQEMQLDLPTRTGFVGPGEFHFGDGFARGNAERIDFEGPDITRLTRARFTTCAPGQDDWFLKIRELELDTDEDIGTAYHTSLSFLGVPVFYLPYLSFPISDERKSGFLIPRLGHSSNRGTELAAPYYFNLAPQYDDTLTPHYMSSRGLLLQNEFRYLTPRSHGELDLETLQNDDRANSDDRAAGVYRHDHVFDPLWSAHVDVRGVSDKQYFDDFGDNLGVTSQTHLPQNAQVDYRGPRWNFSARAADYQTIDPSIAPADRPYARLPQLTLSLNQATEPNRLNYFFDSELVSFERDASINGERLSLSPAVTWPLSGAYGFLTPRLGVRHIAYRLSDSPGDSPSLTRGVFSLDSGLVFEREISPGGRAYTQTLEPRLYYLFVPRANQDNLPNFDTAVAELSFSNLFRDNRFSGGDRLGDANQLAAAVTTRFLDDEDGAERGRASLGKIFYFDDREVSLPADTETGSGSDLVGEAAATLRGNWHAHGALQWRPRDGHTQRYSLYLQYNPAKDRIVNIGRRVTRDSIEQTDISAEWPLAARWTFRGRSLRSQETHRTLESYAGVEYNACCWALRVLGKRRLEIDPLASTTVSEQRSIMLELELTGLSNLGRVPESPLRESLFSFPERAPAAP